MRWLLLVAIGLGAGLAPWQRRPSKAIQVAFWQTVRGYEFLCVDSRADVTLKCF